MSAKWTTEEPTEYGVYWTRDNGICEAQEFESGYWYAFGNECSWTTAEMVRRGYEWWSERVEPPDG